jgi:hypothetical protein
LIVVKKIGCLRNDYEGLIIDEGGEPPIVKPNDTYLIFDPQKAQSKKASHWKFFSVNGVFCSWICTVCDLSDLIVFLLYNYWMKQKKKEIPADVKHKVLKLLFQRSVLRFEDIIKKENMAALEDEIKKL